VILEQWPIEKFIEYINNPRKNDPAVDKVASAINEFGFRVPVVAKSDGTLVDGHLRLKAARKLNLKEIPVLLADDLTEAQIKAFRISVNQVANLAEWDIDLLKIELEGLDELDFDLDLLGFDDDFLSEMLQDEIGEGLTDEDAVPDVPDEPITKRGDIWVLGQHRLMCGDSTMIDDVEKLMDGELADQLVTDPPYNVSYKGKTKESLTLQNDSMSNDDFRAFLRDAFSCADTVMKQGAVFYVWHADSEGYNFRGACFDVSWTVRQCLIWNKNSMVMGRQDYHWKHEPCLYGWKDGAGHLWNTDRKQVTILEFNRPTKNIEHPTMKPVDLMAYQILNNTKGQDIVLDLFGGSGTTLIACEKNNRYARLLELDPKYCDVIVKRWEDYTGNTAVLVETNQFNEVKANA